MPDTPWASRTGMEPGVEYLAMATYLPLKRFLAMPFVRGVAGVRRHLATADGLIGYTMRAKPLARNYWTLSVWRDEAALRTFMATPPHVQVMSSLKAVMGPTRFVRWTVTAADGRPDWKTALQHLATG